MPTTAPPVAAGACERVRAAGSGLGLGRLRPSDQALLITAGFVGMRLVTSPLVGLGVDESYTVAVSRQLSLSYFDHPPLHQWIVGVADAAGASGRILRAPFIVLSGVTSWLMFLLTRRLFGPAAGVWATLAFNLAGFFTVAAGSWILPDGPLNLWLLASALALTSILFPHVSLTSADQWRGWLGFGAFLGLAALSKYQAVLFGAGAAAFFLTTPGRWRMLVSPKPVAAAVLTLALISPVLMWNADNGWASFLFQGARGGVHHGPQLVWVVVAILGQAALALPWIYAPLLVAAAKVAAVGPADDRRWLCLMLGTPAIVIFSLTPLWGEHALPHWSMSGWLMIFPLLGAGLEAASRRGSWPRVWAWGSAVATVSLWILAASETDIGWLPLAAPGLARDPTVETVGWSGLRPVVLQAKAADRRCLFVAALNWREGGKVGAAVGDLAPVRVLSDDPRGFGYLKTPPSLVGCDALVIGSRETIGRGAALIGRSFLSTRPGFTHQEGRNGRLELSLVIVPAQFLLRPLTPSYGRSGARLAS